MNTCDFLPEPPPKMTGKTRFRPHLQPDNKIVLILQVELSSSNRKIPPVYTWRDASIEDFSAKAMFGGTIEVAL